MPLRISEITASNPARISRVSLSSVRCTICTTAAGDESLVYYYIFVPMLFTLYSAIRFHSCRSPARKAMSWAECFRPQRQWPPIRASLQILALPSFILVSLRQLLMYCVAANALAYHSAPSFCGFAFRAICTHANSFTVTSLSPASSGFVSTPPQSHSSLIFAF